MHKLTIIFQLNNKHCEHGCKCIFDKKYEIKTYKLSCIVRLYCIPHCDLMAKERQLS